MESGWSGGLMSGMMAGTLVLLVTLAALVTVGVRLVLRTEREKNLHDAPDPTQPPA